MKELRQSTILLIEDETEIAEILRLYLEHEGFACHHVTDGRRSLELLRRLKPDLIVLDIRLPGQNGIDILQNLRAESAVPIIMLTALSDDVNKLVSLRLGADDYITKPFNPAEVVARVHAVLRRAQGGIQGQRDQGMIEVGPLSIDSARHVVQVNLAESVQNLALTLTEFKLLEFLARQPDRCFCRYELIEACMPESDALDRVVDSHLSKLRKKLSEAGCTGMIETVRGVGYRLWQAR